MEKPKVYFVNTEQMGEYLGGPADSLIDRLERLWNHKDVDLKEWVKPGDNVVIKTHFGAPNQTRHLRPMYIRKIADLVRKTGAIPWVGECVGLGLSPLEATMNTAPQYMRLAAQHGFSLETMDAPIIMLDGVWGTDVSVFPNDAGKYLKKTAVATGLRAADKILIVSHFKGHDQTGFGGALKQLGIGCVGKQGKGEAHFGHENIYIKNPMNCTACRKCLRVCPSHCLSLEGDRIVLANDRCIACLHCAHACPANANPDREKRVFRLRRYIKPDELVERMMDNAAGVIKALGPDRIRYINIAIDITNHCDCEPFGGHPLVPDQGVLYSEDPVAIDQACVDLVTNARGLPGSPAEAGIHLGPPEGGTHVDAIPSALEPGNVKLGLFSAFVDPELRSKIVEIQLSAAEARGVGSRSYALIDVTKESKNQNH